MNNYAYQAVNAAGLQIEGTLEVSSQSEALRRIKEMGLFPTKLAERRRKQSSATGARVGTRARFGSLALSLPLFRGRVKPAAVVGLTRQLATLIEAGMPLLRGLRVLQQQERNRILNRVIGEVGERIEEGSTLSEALAVHPHLFNALYINMVKAGEIGGALEITLKRLAEFLEKAQKIKGKVKAAMFYPAAVMFVAAAILAVMMLFVVPRFKQVFDGLLEGTAMPAFTMLVLRASDLIRHNALWVAAVLAVAVVSTLMFARTKAGRWMFDQFKLTMPVLGPVFRKASISRFARTLGTLLGSGVPILQALDIVRQTAGNVVVGNVISTLHDSVKEGEAISGTLRGSKVFPPMVVGMVDIGEQAGALPDMLMKIADNCDEEVDNAVSAMTSLLEPIMIVFLALVVGSIVIALFLPLIIIIDRGVGPAPASGEN